jgi:uncharacterized protein (DUF885 family)
MGVPTNASRVSKVCVTVVIISLLCGESYAQQPSAADRQHQLRSLFEEEWQYELKSQPERSTAIGDTRYNDKLDDASAGFYQSDVSEKKQFLSRFEAISADGLSHEDALSLSLMIRHLREDIEGAQFKPWEMPVNQMNGIHLELADLVTLTPFNTVGDYRNYLARLHAVPRKFDQVTANMRQGMKDGLMPPKYLLEKVAAEAQQVADTKEDSTPFAKPLEKFPFSIATPDQQRLRKEILSAIRTEVIPAYRKFAVFVRDEYAPRGRSDPGVWSLPDGDARYRYQVRRMTTTELTPDQIHELGLKQIAEIEAGMIAVAHKLGYKNLASLNDAVKKDRKLYASSGHQLLDLYSKYVDQMRPKLPTLFGRLPKSPLIVIPMDPFRAPSAVPADYTPGSADGSRPGRINVNEWDPEHRLLLNVEPIAYHEGIPGHHLQLSIAHELTDVPTFRRHGEYTAFVEGWALYSERLAKELGFYQDPYSDYGRLENEMWRAIRLVIDTGVHAKHWSRDQMVALFHRYTAMDEPNVQTEVDRYIAWPGQALAYKLGQLEILKLRGQAQEKLRAKFDIRAFHDEVLSNGALPLDVLDSEVSTWMERQMQAQ